VEIPDGALPSVEVMATQHLKDLRAHRPHGPYLLGGFCIGGLIAYEMAQRLSAVGEEVLFVALIDPELPGAFLRGHLRLVRWLTKRRSLAPRQTTRLFSRGHKFLYRLREEWNAPFREKIRFVAAKVRNLFDGDNAAQALSVPEGSVDHDEDVLATFQWILSSYVPPRYDGPVTIFVTEEQESFTPFLERKWQKAAPQAEVHRLAGRHLGSITTNVEVLAGKLRECLERIPASGVGCCGWAIPYLSLVG
jgi:thioesterase domain-containing protein